MTAWRLLIGVIAVAACVAPLVAQETAERNISRVRQAADTFDKGRKWAVVIGINKYLDPAIHELDYAVADARLVAKHLSENCGYPEQQVLVISDDQEKEHLRPFGINLRKQIANWLKLAKAGDTVMVFFSGHGFQDDRNQGFLAPKDCELDNLGLSGYRVDDLRDQLQQCQASQKLLVLDCCHAGSNKGDDDATSSEALSAAFTNAAGLVTLASCSEKEHSYEWKEKSQGLFTYFLCQGLAGAADYDKDSVVDHLELYRFTSENVPVTAQRELNLAQNPVQKGDVRGVFALARVSRERLPATPAPSAPPPAPAMPGLPENFSADKLAGTTWSLLDENGDRSTLEFLAGGKLAVTVSNDSTPDNDAWDAKAEQGVVRFYFNDKFVTYEGRRVDGHTLVGTARNNDNKTWTWRATLAASDSNPSRAITNSIGMKLVPIAAGRFTMGSPATESDRDASEEQREVTIERPFYVGAYEVTQREYLAVMGTNPSAFSASGSSTAAALVAGSATDEFPVDSVSWDDANTFCQRLSALAEEVGRRYRLPTSAEWEYVARGGTQTTFPWGNTADGSEANCNGGTPYGTAAQGPNLGRTTRVGSYAPNGFGLYDVAGNLYEWCSDEYRDAAAQLFDAKPATWHVLRGGSWIANPRYCRTAFVHRDSAETAPSIIGFRVVCEIAEPQAGESSQ